MEMNVTDRLRVTFGIMIRVIDMNRVRSAN